MCIYLLFARSGTCIINMLKHNICILNFKHSSTFSTFPFFCFYKCLKQAIRYIEKMDSTLRSEACQFCACEEISETNWLWHCESYNEWFHYLWVKLIYYVLLGRQINASVYFWMWECEATLGSFLNFTINVISRYHEMCFALTHS
jgi:predicted GNAT superfamily acetyltransferase